MSSVVLQQDPRLKDEVVGQLIDVRHMTLAGLTVLSYDILLTLEDERQVVWNSPKRSFSKTIYAFYRYNTLVGGAFFLAFMIPLWDYSREWWAQCVRAGIGSVSLAALAETAGNAIILNELIKLWACSKRMSYSMIAGFLIIHFGTLAATVVAITQLKDTFWFLKSDHFRMCISAQQPTAFKGIFVPSVVLQLYWALLLFLNALSRPRSNSQNLLNLLWSDGLAFFIVMFSLRFLSLLITVAAPAPIAVLGVAMPILLVNAIVCRLYLWLNSPKGLLLRQRLRTYGMETDEWTEETETEMHVQLKSTHSSTGHMNFE